VQGFLCAIRNKFLDCDVNNELTTPGSVDFHGRIFHVKGTRILAALTAVLVFSLLGCGGAAIGDLRTITLSASPNTNLAGEGGTVQLFATGTYSTGAQKDLTNRVTFTATIPVGSTDDTGAALQAPPNTITISSTGLVTAVAPFVCTWIDTTPTSTTASWVISGSYHVVASFGGVTSQPLFITVASQASSTNPKGNCGP
jgi:hypothetical protein